MNFFPYQKVNEGFECHQVMSWHWTGESASDNLKLSFFLCWAVWGYSFPTKLRVKFKRNPRQKKKEPTIYDLCEISL